MLIRSDRKFGRFIRFYPENTQTHMMSTLIQAPNKSQADIDSLIDLFQIVNLRVKNGLASLLKAEFFSNDNVHSKHKLAPLLLREEGWSMEQCG